MHYLKLFYKPQQYTAYILNWIFCLCFDLIGNYEPLKVNVDFGSGQVSVGQSIQLTCTTTGPPAYAIRWKQGSTLIMPSRKYSIVSNSLDTSILTIYNASISDTGTYECIAYSYYTADIASKEDTLTVDRKHYIKFL